MLASPHRHRIPSGTTTPHAVAGLYVDECAHDLARIAIPRPEVHLVVRFGPMARQSLDVHAIGVRQTAHRKLIRGGQRTVFARLNLGTCEAVLGVHASDIANRIVALENLWGDTATRQLLDRLAHARSAAEAGIILESAIAERTRMARRPAPSAQLALLAAGRLQNASVATVARDLGVSERQLRRVFHEAVGTTPKAYARLARFHRALGAARGHGHTNWSSIAASSGYYDQPHLIAEFRAITGVTPRALLAEIHGEDTSESVAFACLDPDAD